MNFSLKSVFIPQEMAVKLTKIPNFAMDALRHCLSDNKIAKVYFGCHGNTQLQNIQLTVFGFVVSLF